MYQITNTDCDEHKGVCLAEGTLYEIMKRERYLIAAANLFNCNEIEKAFNEIVEHAVIDYEVFLANIATNPSQLVIELMTNFIDFFELIIDIKKEEVAETAAAEAAASAAAVVTTAAAPVVVVAATNGSDEHELPPKRGRKAQN